jgi:carbonic anhydrase
MKLRTAGRYISLLVSVFGFVVVACAAPPPEKAAASGDHATPAAHGTPAAHAAPHWEYEGEAGPSAWGGLSPDFAACAAGQHQSPIDLAAASPATPEQRTAFPSAEVEIRPSTPLADAVHNGHTIQIDLPKGDTLTLGAVPFELVQFHFHAPSEHTVAGSHFPMEIHFVHRSAEGKLAVVGVLVAEGAANSAFERIETALPKSEGGTSQLEGVAMTVGDLLPGSHAMQRYDGSLTTPPCSEQVSWLVMTTPIELSAAQIATVSSALPDNSRPVQPLNGRAVVADELGVRTGSGS